MYGYYERFVSCPTGLAQDLRENNRTKNLLTMPAKSEKQRRLMGAALAYKRGENKHPSSEVKHVAESMTERELAEMAKKPRSEKKAK